MNTPSFAEVFGISLAAALLLGLAQRWGFFRIPLRKDPHQPRPRFVHVAAAFGLYLITFLIALWVVAPVLLQWFSGSLLEKQIKTTTLLHCLIYLCILGTLQFVLRNTSLTLWHDPQEKSHFWQDCLQAVGAWIIAFPLVLALQGILQLVLAYFFHIFELPDQIAVYILKMTLQYPLYLLLTLVTIVFLAPIVEELLFRGFLQSYFRRYLSAPWAIGLTSSIFALFHFSAAQKISNLPILLSLFTLALFLGWLYEKQRSLLAPIALHILFNGVNALQLYTQNG